MTTEDKRRIPEDVSAAVTALYRAAYHDVLRSATLLTGQAHTAADLVQQAFHEAALKWHEQGLGSSSLGGQTAWLKTVCRRRHIDGLRRKIGFDEMRIDVYEQYTADGHDPAAVTVARAALDRCWAAIKAMPEAQRTVAVLAWRNGLDTAEIARDLGISQATVRVQLHRARLHRAREIGDDLPEAVDSAAAKKRRKAS
ncbi:RNA polymerase sigma factor [Kitasatospora sp. NPDC098663]|uniref:RNA polymerase sigma factor n=1 Tax=Kitasatospora sp. NPDC098663 TaxID=3364096 RepID=UPI0038202452